MTRRILGRKFERSLKGRATKARLGMERLEQREVLATFVVTSTAPDLLGTTAGSLNNCIIQANADPVPDTIVFDSSLTPNQNTGLINIDAKWLRRITNPVTIDGLTLPDGTSRTSTSVALVGPKDTTPFGYNIGPSLLDFSAGSTGSTVKGLNFLGNNGNAISAQNVDGIDIRGSYFGLSASGAVKSPNGAGVLFVNVNNGKIVNNNFNYNRGAAIQVSGQGNVIRGNSISNNGAGIVVSGTGAGNTISGNSIYLNIGNGIDIGTNANVGVKAPVLTGVTLRSPNFGFGQKVLTINGKLVGEAPNSTYTVQFFVTPANSTLTPNQSQGRYYFQSFDVQVATDAQGNGSFSKAINASLASLLGAPVNLGDYVTATATLNSDGSSSGFSNTQPVARQLTTDLSITMLADPTPVDVGTILEFTMNVDNAGPDASTFTTVTDNLNAAYTFVSATSTQGTVSVDASNKLVASLGTLDAARTAQIKVRVLANAAGTYSNTAVVSTSTFDLDPLNDSATVTVVSLPTPKADLFLDGNFSPSVIPQGESSIYTLAINNNGPEIARGGTLVTEIGDGVSYVSATNDHGTVTYDPNTKKLYATLGAIEVAGKATLNIIVRGEAPGVATLTTTVATSSQEISPSTNTITSDITVVDVPGKLQFPRSSYSSLEGNRLYIPVTRVQGTYGDAQVLFNTVAGTATPDVNYVPVTNYVVDFPNGDTATKYVPVQLLNAADWFAGKSLSVTLTDASGAELGSPSTATINIKSVQPVPVGSISSFTATPNPVLEGGVETYTVTRTGGSNKALVVNYATANGTAIAGVNYTATTGTLTWADGEMGSKTFTVPVLQDNVYTPTNLNFNVNLTAGNTDTTFTTATTQNVSIINTTQTSTVSFNPTAYSVNMNAGQVVLTVNRAAVPISGVTGQVPAFSVSYATANGSAIAGTDYTAASGTISWAAGDVSPKTISVPVLSVAAPSLDKQFSVGLSNPVLAANGSIIAGTAGVTITGHNVDTQGPVISLVQLSGTATSFDQIFLTFSEPLNAASASNVANYVVLDPSNNHLPISGVQYLSASNAVVVSLPAGTTRANTTYGVVVSGTTPSGVTDLFGNLLNGSGTNGTNFFNFSARGTAFSYVDNLSNMVTLGLKGGFMDLIRYSNGGGRSLSTYNTTSASVLSGTVKPLNASGTGYTRFDYLSGVGQPFNFRVTATTPPFLWAQIKATNPPLPGGVSATKLAANKLRRGK